MQHSSDEIRLFVYGTLKDPYLFEKITGRRPQYISAYLPDFEQIEIIKIKKKVGKKVNGFLIENLTKEELVKFDRYEREGRLYTREEHVVLAKDGIYHTAFVYIPLIKTKT